MESVLFVFLISLFMITITFFVILNKRGKRVIYVKNKQPKKIIYKIIN